MARVRYFVITDLVHFYDDRAKLKIPFEITHTFTSWHITFEATLEKVGVQYCLNDTP